MSILTQGKDVILLRLLSSAGYCLKDNNKPTRNKENTEDAFDLYDAFAMG